MRRVWWLGLAVLATAGGCNCRAEATGPPVPASSDPTGKDLVEGAVVAATEKQGGVRLYKIKKVSFFPPPMTDELVMIAFAETGNDFVHAAKLWQQRKLTVVLPNVRVARGQFVANRDYRVIAREPVVAADKALDRGDALGPKP